jgi:adenylate cyclase
LSSEHVERRLAAILAADVAGSCRLIGIDEEGTLAQLKALRKTLFDPKIAQHRGRVVKNTGDGALVEFASVVDAVRCAVEVQRGMAERNTGVPQDKRIEFRIGIHVGDIIIEEDDIFGDGVNIAARLEGIAEPGGICISDDARRQVRGKVESTLEDIGAQTLKNIAEPMRVWRVRIGPSSSPAVVAKPPTETAQPLALPDKPSIVPKRRVPMPRSARRAGLFVAAAILFLIVGIGATSWYLNGRHQQPIRRLSIVVLPFTNLSSDPEQEYLADAITNDLTTNLSRIGDSFVIAPSSARAYKGRNLDARQIGRELNVRYILDGSLRRTENQVRINAQLIDAETDAAIWSDRFDGDWTKSMQLQDEITGRLARRLDLELTEAESRRAQSERPNNPNAVDLAMRGSSLLNQPKRSREQLFQSRDFFEQALRIEPELPRALLGLARTLIIEVNNRWSNAPAEQLARATAAVDRVPSVFPNDAMAHFLKGEILKFKDSEAAIRELEAAISINPSLAPAYAELGVAKIHGGRAEEAFAPLQMAIRLSPRDPQLNIWSFQICHAYTHLGRDADAIEWCRRSVALGPVWFAYVDLASAYAWTGQSAEAHAAVAELLKLMPNYTVDRWAHAGISDNPVFLAQYLRITEGLRKAGLPEK